MKNHSSPDRLPTVIADPGALRASLVAARASGKSVGIVPTMGALHAGHLSLVERARQECDFTVVTIFVNPAQFAPGDDLARYPRNLEADCQALAPLGVDLVFAPTNESMYGPDHASYVEVAGPALDWEGRFRPGHFRGVTTIVLKLFSLIGPAKAYFGRKDFQQSLVVQRMVADLDLPIDVEVCPTMREPDGLAMSSRNVYLSPEERQRALSISKSLQLAKQLAAGGETRAAEILAQMTRLMEQNQLQIDYLAIVEPKTLNSLQTITGPAVALVAARVGKTRLIDNEILK